MELRDDLIDFLHSLLSRRDLVLLNLTHFSGVSREVGRQVRLVAKLRWQVLPGPVLPIVDEQEGLLVVKIALVALRKVLQHSHLLISVANLEFDFGRRELVRHTVHLLDPAIVFAEDGSTRLIDIARVEHGKEVLRPFAFAAPVPILLQDGFLLHELCAAVDVQEYTATRRLRFELVARPVLKLRLTDICDVAGRASLEELRETPNLLEILVLECVLDHNVETLKQLAQETFVFRVGEIIQVDRLLVRHGDFLLLAVGRYVELVLIPSVSLAQQQVIPHNEVSELLGEAWSEISADHALLQFIVFLNERAIIDRMEEH